MPVNRRRQAALERLAATGLWRSTYLPFLVRGLWRLGIDAPPPLLASFWTNVLLNGLPFGTILGLCQWLNIFSSEDVSFNRALVFGSLAGLIFGLSMAYWSDRKRQKYGLPTWDELGRDFPSDSST